MNLMSRLSADARQARRLREARAAIRRADRTVALRLRMPDPGYDELSNVWFVGLMLLAVAVIVADIRGDIDTTVVRTWLQAIVAAVRACL